MSDALIQNTRSLCLCISAGRAAEGRKKTLRSLRIPALSSHQLSALPSLHVMPDDKIFWQYLRGLSFFPSICRFFSAEFTIGEVLLSKETYPDTNLDTGVRLNFDLLGIVVQYTVYIVKLQMQ